LQTDSLENIFARAWNLLSKNPIILLPGIIVGIAVGIISFFVVPPVNYSGDVATISYDALIIALGSVTDLAAVPGMAEHGVGVGRAHEQHHGRDRRRILPRRVVGEVVRAARAERGVQRQARRPRRLLAPAAHGILVESLLGALLAGVTAYASVAFLTRYFRTNDLRPFGWYCLTFGSICFTLANMKVVP